MRQSPATVITEHWKLDAPVPINANHNIGKQWRANEAMYLGDIGNTWKYIVPFEI